MPRRAHPLILLPAVLMCLVSGAQAQQRSTATYRVTFRGTWTTAVTPGGLPSGAHFTTLIGGVHNSDVTFLREGGMASAGVELMAELGGTRILTNEVRAAEPNALSVIRGSGNIGPTGSSTINMVTLTTDHPRVTLLTMIAPSPDWFVGVFGRSLLDERGGWLPSLVVNLYPWDAGTEDGSEFSLSNPATSPQGVITSLRGKGKFSNERIATLTFTRQSVNTAPSFSSGTSFVADENQTTAGTLIAVDPDNGDMVTYAITGGADASKFDIGSTTGVLTFKTPPNYERAADAASSDPLNEAGNNEYILTVTATGGTDDRAMTAEQTITVNVRNLDETGTVSFSQVGASIRTRLSDPDGGVSGERWQWARSSDRSTGWVDISGATADRYSPSSDDEQMYLRATVSYSDTQGSGKQAQGVSTFEISPPDLRVDTLVSGLSIPWDIAFTPDGTMLFTQRGGVLSSRLVDGTVQTIDAEFGDLFARGETGLMAIVVDPNFISNRRLYTCQGHAGPEVQVIAWTINDAYSAATRVADPLVGGMPTATSGRHGGCRLRFGPEGYLWIATGDAASGRVPQDLTSLGGKVLRVDASTGAGAPTNPFASSPRVYTYGHRNVQGLALRSGTSQMWSVEHGPSVDDEINLLAPGRNYGWDPVPGYNERVPMTDLVKFPDAVEAKWSSGSPTLATSGGIFLEGEQWGVWEGRLAVATLKDSKLRLFEFTPDGAFVSQVVVPELDGEFGRLRTPMAGPDGTLYVTTSNGGGGDRILRIAPDVTTAPPAPPPDGDGPSVPEAPENLTAVGGDGLAVLRWNAPENDGGAEITEYEYRLDRSNPWISTGSTNTTHTVTGLVNGVTYLFQVRAVNSIGKSLASNQAEVTPEVTGDRISYFPHLAVGESWQTTITLINYSPEEVTCQTDFLSDQGTPLMVSFPALGTVVSRIDILPPGGSVHEETNVDLSAPQVSGWARATCSRPVKASLLFRQHDSDGIPVAEAGVNAATAPASRFVTFAERQEGKAGTGVAYANPSSTEALITFTAKDAAGQTLASEDLRVSPGGHGARNMAELFGLSSFSGSLEVTSTAPIVSLSLNFEAAPAFSSLPPGEPDPSTQEPTTYYFPHLAVGESWQTTITYINDSPQEVTCRTEFISDHGNPLLVSFPGRGMLDRRTDVLPPGGSVHEETDADLSASLVSGWARATCSGPVKASLLFRRYDSEGMPMGEAGVNAAAEPATRFVTFAEQARGQPGTGVAYANPSTKAAHITFTARDAAGQVLAVVDRTVLPEGHEEINMEFLFDIGSFAGSLEVTSTEPIVSLSINAEAAPVFSSLPPGEVDESAP
ncbi:MAG: PQQ-dependent sugar dehydrogenase [Bryobacterales bacterium]|nr:PQQ-dependent sugar dehydrogenase [Bryobacterales bacterium]MDE0295325.1 PQQ-dependent sugar dehydrogenase [Bryobacterales bacterium]MDE0434668.1 PQQ-dependent sugar dehydrogenase [Bryobacterales bacterium]